MLTNQPLVEVARLTVADLMTIHEPLKPEEMASLETYFGQFAKQEHDERHGNKCVGCGAFFGKDGLSSFLMAGMDGRASMKWGLAHGECHCSKCGWPARAYHFNIGVEGQEPLINSLTLTLQYHPDNVKTREKHDG